MKLEEHGLVDRAALMRALDIRTTRTVLTYERAGMPVCRRGRLRFYDLDAIAEWLRGGGGQAA